MIRFSLQLGHQSWSHGDPAKRLQRTVDLARAADRHRFDSIWITEDPDGWDAFAVLAVLARETTRVHLGTGVTNPFLRHPNLIAASLATLDRISAGRAFLGLGRGQPEWYEHALGVPVVSPLAAVEETVRLLCEWSEPPHVASAAGPIRVDRWERTIWPTSRIPIYLAATGPKMQALAGRIADGVRFNELATIDFLTESIARVRRAAIEAERDPALLRFFFSPGIRVTSDPASALDGLKTTIALIHALPGMDRQLRGDGLATERVIERVRALMKTREILEKGGASSEMKRAGNLEGAKRAIPDDFVLSVAAVGSVEEVRAKLARLAEIGVTDFFYDIHHSPGGIDGLGAVLAALQDRPTVSET